MRVLQVQRYSRRLRIVSILIPILFVLGWATLFIGMKWFYKDVHKHVLGVGILFGYGSVFWSFIHLIIVTTKPNIGIKNKLLWSAVTAIPIIGLGLILLFIDD